MGTVIRFVALENPERHSIAGGVLVPGAYLAAFDPDANDGHGVAVWSTDADEAMVFVTTRAAVACLYLTSQVRPVKDNGAPNRPLTAFKVEFEPLRMLT